MSKFDEIYLHIGLHKTGTTTVQNFFHRNRHIFEEQASLLYPASASIPENHSICLGPIFKQEINTQFLGRFGFLNKSRDQVRQELLGELEGLLDATRCRKLLFSAEILCRLTTAEIKLLQEWLGQFCCPIKVLVYMRHPLDWYESSVNTIVNHGQGLDQAMRQALKAPDITTVAARWSDVFGKDAVQIFSLEQQQKNAGSLLNHFASVLEIDRETLGQCSGMDMVRNERLSMECTQLFARLNLQRPLLSEGELSTKRNYNDRDCFMKIRGRKFHFTAEQHLRFKEAIDRQIQWLKRTHNIHYSVRDVTDSTNGREQEGEWFSDQAMSDIALVLSDLFNEVERLHGKLDAAENRLRQSGRMLSQEEPINPEQRVDDALAEGAIEGDMDESMRTAPRDLRGFQNVMAWCEQSERGDRAAWPMIILVTPELTRTGCQIHALQLAKELMTRYRVMVIALADGELRPDFEMGTDLTICYPEICDSGRVSIRYLLQEISHRIPLRYTIVTSTVSAAVMHGIAMANLPIVMLVPEFSKARATPEFIAGMLNYTSELVFPSRRVWEDWLATSYQWTKRKFHIYPPLMGAMELVVQEVMDRGNQVLPCEYSESIDRLGCQAAARQKLENLCLQELPELDADDVEYFLGKHPTHDEEISFALREFICGVAAGVLVRKPCPGNLPVGILNRLRVEGETEITTTGQAGCVALLDKGPPVLRKPSMEVAVHCHLYFLDSLEPIFAAASRNSSSVDWWISFGGNVTADAIRDAAARYGIDRLRAVKEVRNRGRDVGPMLCQFARELMAYPIIGHLHGKASLQHEDRAVVERWNRLLLENTLGGRIAAMDQILGLFDDDPELGLVFPDDPHIDRWGVVGWRNVQDLACRLDIEVENPHGFEFPVGNMYWARSLALAPLLEYDWKWEHLPEEPLALDGTLLHLLERLTPFVVRSQGYHFRTTRVDGVTR